MSLLHCPLTRRETVALLERDKRYVIDSLWFKSSSRSIGNNRSVITANSAHYQIRAHTENGKALPTIHFRSDLSQHLTRSTSYQSIPSRMPMMPQRTLNARKEGWIPVTVGRKFTNLGPHNLPSYFQDNSFFPSLGINLQIPKPWFTVK